MDLFADEPPPRRWPIAFTMFFRPFLLLQLIHLVTHASTIDPTACSGHFTPPKPPHVANVVGSEAEIIAAVTDIRQACDIGQCTTFQRVEVIAETAIAKQAPSSKLRKWWNYSSIVVRRTAVVGLYIASIVVPPTITGFATQNLPAVISTVLTVIVGQAASSIFFYLRAPIDQRYGPPMASMSMRLWKPEANDRWGNVLAGMDEKERTVAELLGPMLLIMKPSLKAGGLAFQEAIRPRDDDRKHHFLKVAANHYLEAIRQSLHQYKGINIHHNAVIDDVLSRMQTPDQLDPLIIDQDMVREIYGYCIHRIKTLRPEQIPQHLTKEEMISFTRETLEKWFSVGLGG